MRAGSVGMESNFEEEARMGTMEAAEAAEARCTATPGAAVRRMVGSVQRHQV